MQKASTDSSSSFTLASKLRDYMMLVKFSLTFMVVFSAVISYLLAPNIIGFNVKMILLLFVGGFLVTGSANAINMVVEKDTDRDNFLSADQAVHYGLVDNWLSEIRTIERLHGRELDAMTDHVRRLAQRGAPPAHRDPELRETRRDPGHRQGSAVPIVLPSSAVVPGPCATHPSPGRRRQRSEAGWSPDGSASAQSRPLPAPRPQRPAATPLRWDHVAPARAFCALQLESSELCRSNQLA